MTPDPPEPTGTQTSGFTEEERSELKQLIAEAVGAAVPPKTDPAGAGPAVTDAQWDKMTDRQREGFVRDVVSDLLAGLARDDEAARLRAENEALKTPKPEPERPPSVVTKLQKLIWGDPQEQP